MDVRFVQVMANDRYPDELHCGCICAGHMSGELTAAQDRDKGLRSRAQRRAKFPQRKAWRVSANGNPHISVDGIHMIVSRNEDGAFVVGAKNSRDQKHRWGKKRYLSEVEAKKGCFDALEYFEKKQREAVQDILLRSALI